MLTGIQLENFKCFGKRTTIPLARITVFIGPNGSGKSTPIQALMLLKQSIGRTSLELDAPMNLGTFEDLMFIPSDPKTTKPKRLGVGFSGIAEGMIDRLALRLDYQYDLWFERNRVAQAQVVASLGKERAPISWPPPERQVLRGVPLNDVIFRVSSTEVIGRALALEGFEPKKSAFPDALDFFNEHQREINSFLREFASIALRKTTLVPGLRGLSNPTYQLAQSFPEDLYSLPVGQRPGAVASTLTHRRDVEDKLSGWMTRITEIGVRGGVEPGRTTKVESKTSGRSFNIVNEGFGSNQLTDLLLQLAMWPEDSLIAIEEPEIHLHPKAQFALADVLREVALEEKKQLLITTHSEHILFKFLTSIAAGELKPDDLAVHYFQKEECGTGVTALEIDEAGRVKGGLPGFFEAELGQLGNYIEALSRKK